VKRRLRRLVATNLEQSMTVAKAALGWSAEHESVLKAASDDESRKLLAAVGTFVAYAEAHPAGRMTEDYAKAAEALAFTAAHWATGDHRAELLAMTRTDEISALFAEAVNEWSKTFAQLVDAPETAARALQLWESS